MADIILNDPEHLLGGGIELVDGENVFTVTMQNFGDPSSAPNVCYMKPSDDNSSVSYYISESPSDFWPPLPNYTDPVTIRVFAPNGVGCILLDKGESISDADGISYLFSVTHFSGPNNVLKATKNGASCKLGI